MPEQPVPAMLAPPPARQTWRDNPLFHSKPGLIGLAFLALMLAACLLTLPYTLAPASSAQVARYAAGQVSHARIPPSLWPRAWWTDSDAEQLRLNALIPPDDLAQVAATHALDPDDALRATADTHPEAAADLRRHWPSYALGTDALGRSLAVRLLTGGGISLGIGLAAAALSVLIGTAYGAIAGYAGGRLDAVMMRIVDILYGLPYILLVVLLAVAVDATIENWIAARVPRIAERRDAYVVGRLAAMVDEIENQASADAAQAYAERFRAPQSPNSIPPVPFVAWRAMAAFRQARVAELFHERMTPEAVRDIRDQAVSRYGTGELDSQALAAINVTTLLVAIGGVSWLTMSRVIRGQVLSLKAQPFVEAARAAGLPTSRIFLRHLLPNLLGPIIVYATLTVPQAILQESFLSFLGIGVKPPLPSWGNLAAEGLAELNTYQSNWWLLLFPCLLLGSTLLAMNFVGEALREAFDPRRTRR